MQNKEKRILGETAIDLFEYEKREEISFLIPDISFFNILYRLDE